MSDDTPNDETQAKTRAGQPVTDDKDKPAGQSASRSGRKATDTGGAKGAGTQLAEVEGVMQTDPTNAGRNPAVPTAGVGPNAVLLHAGDEVGDELIAASTGQQFVTLDKDIVEEFIYPGTKRPAHRLLFTKGQVVSRATIDTLNANVRATRVAAERGGDADPANPAGVDETTLASGTYPGLPAGK